MKINVGINGFGRIGKSVFIQCLNSKNFNVTAINAVNLNIEEIEDYLRYDSCHKYNTSNIDLKIVSSDKFTIGYHEIKLFSDRDPKNLEWKKYKCDCVIDTTGSFLTLEKAKQHDIGLVVMSAPPKDKTPSFIFGANHLEYKNQKVISSSSCTTNCLAPFLKLVVDRYTIENCCFTTIHSSTSSQFTVDVFKKSTRTKRSIFNNIIPHTTGASKSIIEIFPQLKNKIMGNSVRIPVSNCSLLDITLQLKEKDVTLFDLKNLIMNSEFYNIVFSVNEKELVSSDFMTTTTPCILDFKASFCLGNGNFKLMFWYDNEWSYSSQILRLLQHVLGSQN